MHLAELGISPDFVNAARGDHLGTATERDLAWLESAGWKRLEGGFNNGVYSTECTAGKCCFKFYKVDGRQREEREWVALHFLRRQGFDYVPTPFYYEKDAQAPLLVMEFVEGIPLGKCRLDSAQLTVLIERIKELHAIFYDPAVEGLGKLEGRTRLDGIMRFMGTAVASGREAKDCYRLWEKWVEGEDRNRVCASADWVFSRMDTNLANCLWAEGDMRFVDLEYGGWTDRFFDLAEQVEHGQSRGTPDAEWESFIEEFDLCREERKQFFAAQRLMAFFWATKYWPPKGMQASEPFRVQVERIEQLCTS